MMFGSRVGFWEGHAATLLQPYPLERVPVLRIPEGSLLFSLFSVAPPLYNGQ